MQTKCQRVGKSAISHTGQARTKESSSATLGIRMKTQNSSAGAGGDTEWHRAYLRPALPRKYASHAGRGVATAQRDAPVVVTEGALVYQQIDLVLRFRWIQKIEHVPRIGGIP